MNLLLDAPLDMHLHLREQEMLHLVAPFSAAQFAGGVVMPNLVQPVDSLARLRAYRAAILQACGAETFTPYMTLFFRDYSREELVAAKDEIIGLKLYPAGITTQSEAGVSDFNRIGATVALLEELDIPLAGARRNQRFCHGPGAGVSARLPMAGRDLSPAADCHGAHHHRRSGRFS